MEVIKQIKSLPKCFSVLVLVQPFLHIVMIFDNVHFSEKHLLIIILNGVVINFAIIFNSSMVLSWKDLVLLQSHPLAANTNYYTVQVYSFIVRFEILLNFKFDWNKIIKNSIS